MTTNKNKKIVICDLDGTISDARARVKKYLFEGVVCDTCGYKQEYTHKEYGTVCGRQTAGSFGISCRGTIKKVEKDWDGFYGAVGEDKPMEHTLSLLQTLAKTYRVVFVTGRRESCRKDTMVWLMENFIHAPYIGNSGGGGQSGEAVVVAPPFELYMRADYDHSQAFKLKRNILKNLLDPKEVAFVFEDEVSTIEMYKKECPNATIIDVTNYLWGDRS